MSGIKPFCYRKGCCGKQDVEMNVKELRFMICRKCSQDLWSEIEELFIHKQQEKKMLTLEDIDKKILQFINRQKIYY